ncbi:ribosome-inactivating family protein [Spiroplasma poulsonii]|nr:ribosome-inactivating family protein [Spiroplasma poulsonii]
MKKILSLLSVLTISGTAVPTTIAASSYKKEEFKLENNLEILNRVKRGNNKNKKPKKNTTSTIDEEDNRPSTSRTNNRCSTTAGGVRNQRCRRPNENNSEITTKSARERFLSEIEGNSNNIFTAGKRENTYGVFIRKSIDYFKETNNIVEETTHPDTNWKIYKIEKHSVEDSYKKIPLKIAGNKIDLILNKSSLYVDGIITHNNGDGTEKKLFYFSDSNLDKNSESLNSNDKYKLFGKILDLEIKTDNNLSNLSHKLAFDSNYNTLAPESLKENIKINKETIRAAITNLSNINDSTIKKIKKYTEKEKKLKKDFLRVIFTAAEATRFFSIRQEVNKILTSSDSNQYEINWQDHKDTLTNWDKNSQKYYEMKNGKEFTDEEKQTIYNVAILAVKDDEKIRDNQKG